MNLLPMWKTKRFRSTSVCRLMASCISTNTMKLSTKSSTFYNFMSLLRMCCKDFWDAVKVLKDYLTKLQEQTAQHQQIAVRGGHQSDKGCQNDHSQGHQTLSGSQPHLIVRFCHTPSVCRARILPCCNLMQPRETLGFQSQL
jgi:hypothetical protein